MIIGYQDQFEAAILSGLKTSTIRKDPKRRWRVGMTMHKVTGHRTKRQRQFATATVTAVEEVRMHILKYRDAYEAPTAFIRVGDVYLNDEAQNALAKQEGFEDLAELLHWFAKHGEKAEVTANFTAYTYVGRKITFANEYLCHQ